MKTPEDIAREIHKNLYDFPSIPTGGDLRWLMVKAIVADREQQEDSTTKLLRKLARVEDGTH